jgi:TRAP-type uncharacterized transport system substrate-binding protein
MQKLTVVDSLLTNINNIHELGRQRAFELGNPFYAKYEEDGGLYRKELPNGELFLVEVKIVTDENDMPVDVKDTIIKKLTI